MKNLKYLILAIVTFSIDMWQKKAVEKWVSLHGREECAPVKGRYFTRHKRHNRGLAMNIASAHQKRIAAVSFVTTAALAINYLFSLKKTDSPLLKTGLSLQLGGACSNTYDRVKRGYVVDYFSINVPGKLGKIVFNIADMAILAGSFLAILDAFIRRKGVNP